MPRLILLIGLPGSGKSTLAKQLMQERPDRCLISTDEIRSRLFGAEDVQGSWGKVFTEVGRQFRQSVQQIGRGEVSEAIYDATNAVRKQRRQAIALARVSGFTHITGLWLNVPLWVCLRRNRERDRQVPDDVIDRMSRRIYAAPPSEQEGMDWVIEISARKSQKDEI